MDALAELVGESPVMGAVRRDVRHLLSTRLAGHRLPAVLIEGETGTGKGLVARLLHRAGPRASGPFVDINCAAIPETMLEAELFGFERGAFTDARRSKPGLFQTAHRGAIFLDEVGLLPDGLQAKLLSVLEQRTVRRLGATSAEPVDVWVLSATNVDLRAAVAARRFREDLYHRLAVLTIRLPPLRERGRDVVLLAERILARVCGEYGLPPRRLGPDAEARLLAHHWPGNVRELANVIERVALLTEREVVGEDMLSLVAPEPSSREIPGPEPRTSAREAAREHLRSVLERTGWNISHTAAALGLARNTVRARIERYGLERRPGPARAPRSARGPRPAAGGPPAVAAPPALDATEAGPASVRWSRRRVVFLRVRWPSTLDAPAMARFVDRCVDKLQSFGGRVDEVGRLTLLATFGTEAAEDAPTRAANAALVIRRLLERDRGTGELPSQTAAAIALHARRVVVAQIGGRIEIDRDDRAEANRALDGLEPLAEDEIAVSDAAAPLLGRHVQLRSRAGGDTAGYAMGGREPRTARAATFVGRGPNLDMLNALLDRAIDGRGQVVAVVGEAGIGKSRVVREFLAAVPADTAHVLEGHCAAYAINVPYFPVVDMLQAALGIDASTPNEVQIAGLRAGLQRIGLDGGAREPYLEALLDPRRAGALRLLSPAAVKARTFDAIRQLMLALEARRPLVIVMEDLHWVDPTSEELLNALTDVVVNHRVLLLTTHRPGYRPPWTARSHVTQLSLGPLSDPESRKLIAALVDTSEPDGESLVTTILARAEGNPFFLEELACTVAAGASVSASLLPTTVTDAVAARIDALPEADRHLLQLGAVIGRDVALRVLVEASGCPEERVRQGLERLQALEFVYPARFEPEPAYAFKHALTREAGYESVTPDERSVLHARAARAIERVHPDIGERRPDVLARHYAAAGHTAVAVEHLRRAGELALRRSANAEAVAHLEQALTLISRAPSDPALASAELMVQIPLASALAAHRGFGSVELEATLARIRVLTDQAGYRPELTPVRFGLWRFALARADLDTAEALVAELTTTAERHPGPGVVVAARAAEGTTAFYLGRLADARRCYEEVAARSDRAREQAGVLVYGQDLGVGPQGYLGWTRTLMGQCDLGARIADEALARAREGGHAFTIAHALNVAGLVRCDRREPALVARHGEEMLALSREGGFPFLIALALALIGWARFAQGALAEGVTLMREGGDRYRDAGQRVGLRARAQLAEALVATGDVRAALDVLDAALAHARATRDGIYLSELLRVKGEALARAGAGEDAALTCLQEAVAVATGQGAWLLALRAATAMARRQRGRDGVEAAAGTLRAIHGRFTEGLDVADVRAAREVLSALA